MTISADECHIWLTLLRSGRLGPAEQRELADILDSHYFFPGPGRNGLTSMEIFIRSLKDLSLRHEVQKELTAMKARGDQKRGGLRALAEQTVADRHKIGLSALQGRIKRAPLRKR